MRESENDEEGERRTPEGEGDGELLSRRKLFLSREGSCVHGRASERDTETKKEKFSSCLSSRRNFRRERGSEEEKEKRERGRRSCPLASPCHGNSVAREGARRRERNGREGGEVLLPPLLVTEIPSRERE